MSTAISPSQVKELRERTNAGMLECKKALEEAKGNLEEAETILRKKGVATAAKKAGRDAREGVIASYIHFDKVGVLVEVNCETDFVAKNESFRQLVRDITLQIAAGSPQYVRREDVPAPELAREKEIAAAQVTGKPAAAVEKIVEGKLEKYYAQVCLLEQPFVKDPNLLMKDLLTNKIQEIGENLVIRRFVRFQVGEALGGEKAADQPE